MFKKLTCVCVLVLALGLAARQAVAGVAYSDPPGGWRYVYPGVGDANPDAAALDGNWDHNNGSDGWDGSLIGAGQAGGIIALSDAGVSFLRIQDALTSGSGTDSRKIYFGHNLTAAPNPMPQATADQILSVEGVTLSFRARLATTPPLDGTWPAGGDGYVIHDGGKGPFGIHQDTGGDQIISFGLVLAGDASGEPKIAGRTGLCMNNLNGTAPSGTVDIQGNEAGTLNMLDIADLTIWHEFWITIRPDTSGTGTHKVQVWMDGSMVASEFNVTAGTGGDYDFSYVGMGAGATPQAGATDVDFFAYKEGIHLPPGAQRKAYDPIPEDGSRPQPSGPEGDGFYMLLQFTAGDDATTHTAYFSSNFDDVNDRNGAVSLGSPPYPDEPGYETAYYVGLDDSAIPEFARTPLHRGITYYWAVDESNDTSTYPGDVWSFTIASDTAWSPTPPDGAQNIRPASVALAWLMGDVDTGAYNVSYDVYWGTDEAAVAADTIPDAHVTVPTHTIVSLLNDTDYYWKVDTSLMSKNPPFTITIIPGDVWQFTTRVFTPITDDDTLVGWWTFEPDTGNIVFDQSGYNNDGTIVGGSRGPGYIEDAIVLDGVNDYVNCGNSSVLDFGTGNWTVCAWVQVPEGQADTDTVFANGGDEGGGIRYALAIGEATNDGCVTLTTDDDTTKLQAVGVTPFNDGEWHHVIGQRLGNTLLVFVDAAEDAGNPGVPVGYNLSGTSQHNACIGAITDHRDASGATLEKYFEGSIDDVRVYNRALSSKEIKVLAGRLNATNPDPYIGQRDVSRTPTLRWSPGVYVASANGNIVYYSDDRNAVITRAAPSDTVTDPCYVISSTLDLGTTYYWAVDTVNGLDVWPGDLWRFTTIDWLSIDNMESYVPYTAQGDHIYEAWQDAFGDCLLVPGNNTGATLNENADIVLGGIQSMKYDYDNDGTVYNPCTMNQEGSHLMYSRIEAQIAGLPSGIDTNWTIQGVKALSLRFYGGQFNGVEPMWVQLKDADGYGNKVKYGDYQDEDPNAVTEESWHEWFIDMADFGVNPANLVSIVIGFGNDDGSGAHGNGTVFFDDFRLCAPRCMPSRHTEELAKLDFAGPTGAPDCVVDWYELDVMADDWLLGDAFVTAAARPVPDPNLAAWWKFDDGSGTTAIDSSGKASALTLSGAITWEDGISGGAVHFRGVGSGTGTLTHNANAITVCAWVNHDEFISGQVERYVTVGSEVAVIRKENDGRLHFYIQTGGSLRHLWVSDVLTKGQWHSVAGAWDGLTQRLYIDGVLIASQRPGGVLGTASSANVSSSGEPFNGMLDDVRIYNYALTHGEILSLAGLATLYVPVPSSAEIYEGEAQGSRVVNFKDYAELMDSWLLEVKYPQ